MKRNIKILSFVMSIALIVCGFVFSAIVTGAADTEYGSGFTYTTVETVNNVSTDVVKNEATDLGKVLDAAKYNSTIKMNADVVYDIGADHGEARLAYVNSAKGKLTLDLGGHTLTVIQHYKGQSIHITTQLTVINGTIKVLWANSAGTDKTFPLFQLSNANAKLVLEDVNTYGSTMIYSAGSYENVKVEVTGGKHYIMYGFSDVVGGFVETRTSMVFEAKNATFYVAKGRTFISSLSYKAIQDGTIDKESTFRFDNCDIIAESISQNLINCANEYTNFIFNGSRIFGSLGNANSKTNAIEIPLANYDVTYGNGVGTIGAGGIVLGPGTTYATVDSESNIAYFADGTSYGDYKSDEAIVVPAVADAIKNETTTYNYTLNLSPSTLGMSVDATTGEVTYNYDTEETTLSITYDKMVVVPAYEIEWEDGTSSTINYGAKSLAEVIAEACAKDGATIKLLCDVEIESVGNENLGRISNGLTIDLNGCALSIFQNPTTAEPNAQATIRVSTTETVTIKDSSADKSGVIGVKRVGENKAYPFIIADGDEQGKAVVVDIVVEDVTFYGSSIIYIYGGLKSKVTINGGVYNSIYDHVGSIGGFVQAVCDVDMVINDATIYLGSRGRLMGSAARNVSATDAGSTYTFNGCTIAASDVTRNILLSSNQFTRIAFEECSIYGSFAPTITQDFDTNKNNAFGGDVEGPLPNSITFDGSTFFSSSATYTEDIVSPKVGYFTTAESLGYSNRTASLVINELRGEAEYFGFRDGTVTTKTYTLDMTVNPKQFRVTSGSTIDYSPDDFTEAIAMAKSLSDGETAVLITLLGDYTITNGEGGKTSKTEINEYDVATINFPLIIDLDGRTLSFVQGYLQETYKKDSSGNYVLDAEGNKTVNNSAQETIKINSTVTIKDGTLVARNKDSNKSYPFFTSGGGFNLTLENVTSYTGAIFYSYGGSGTFTITGGEHHVPYVTHGGWGASWFETHTALTFTATDARFHVGSGTNIFLVSAISNSTQKNMNYTFDNCDIIGENASNSLIRFANEFTSFEFNGCRIKGMINPLTYTTENFKDANSNKQYNTNPMTQVIFGEGTVYTGTAKEGLISVPKGYVYRESTTTNKVSLYVTETPYVTKETVDGNEIGTIVIAPDRLDTTYTFTYAVLEAVIIEVMDKGGNVVSTTTILPGEAVGTLPELTPTVEETGYVKVTYTGNWVDASGNIVTADSLAGDTDMYIYPEVTVTPYLKDAMLNLELMGHIKPKILLPLTDLPDNIKITAVNLASNGVKGNAMSGSKVTFDGKNYTAYSFNAVGATSIATEYQVIVTYTVDICGRTETVEQPISKISALKYINNVLSQYVVSEKNPTPKDPDASSALVADMLRYSYYVCRLNGIIKEVDGVGSAVNDSTTYSGIATAYNTYKSFCSPFGEGFFELTNPLANAETNLADYIEWIKFDIETYQPKFKIKFKSGLNEDGTLGGNSVVGVKFEVVEGFKAASGSSEINWGQNLAMQINNNYGTSYYNADGNGVYNGYVVKDNDGWTQDKEQSSGNTGAIHIICPDNLPAYNIIRNIRITLTLHSGATVDGVYNLRAYYNSVVDSTRIAEEDKPLVYETLYAIHAYSNTVAEYRFGPAKDSYGWVSYDRANGYGELKID